MKHICLSEGLKPSNDYYGRDLPEYVREKVSDAIFTADCRAMEINGSYINCGSIMLNVPDFQFQSGKAAIAKSLIYGSWCLDNQDQ